MGKRIYRVNRLIKAEISEIIFRELEINEGIITVTAVETLPDLRHSVVWLSRIGCNQKILEKRLDEKKKEIQKSLNAKIHLKYVPKVTFKFDQSGEYMEKISRVFQEIKNIDQ